MDEEDDSSLWWLGAVLYITGSVLSNLGTNLVRKNHTHYQAKARKTPCYQQWWAITGWSIYAVGNVLNFVAFMFTAQSLLAALGSVQFVSNLFFATLINQEKVTRGAIIATCIIITGNILIVLFGSKVSETYGIQELFEFLIRPEFLLYLCLATSVVVLMQILYWASTIYMKHQFSALLQNEETDSRKYLLTSMNNPNKLLVVCWWFAPLAYAVVSGVIGCNSMLLGKMSAGLLAESWDDIWALFNFWVAMIVLLFIFFSGFWLYRINSALKKYDAMYIIPVLQTVWLCTSVLEGGTYFEEFSYMPPGHIALFALGLGILIFGVFVLSFSRKNKKPNSESDDLSVQYESIPSAGIIDSYTVLAIDV